jgi:hypothetical protein
VAVVRLSDEASKGLIAVLNQHAGRIDALVAALNVVVAKLNLDAGVTDEDYAPVATTAADTVTH